MNHTTGDILDVAGYVAAMTSPATLVPNFGLNGSLRIDRNQLAAKTIELAEADRQVYIRGAAGTGKSVLLELIAQKLAHDRKKAVIIPHAEAFEYFWEDIMELTKKDTLYVLIDHVHKTVDKSIWTYLRMGAAPAFITIAAGIPGDANARSLFLHYIDVKDMRLDFTKLHTESVMDYYSKLLMTSCEKENETLTKDKCADVVTRVIEFTHEITAGHCFPCLKMLEYFETVT